MNQALPSHKSILLVAVILFIIGLPFPWGGIGGIAHGTLNVGFPLPWLSVDVEYGPATFSLHSFTRGSIEKIEALHVNWLMLPLALAGSWLLAAVFVGVFKIVRLGLKRLRS